MQTQCNKELDNIVDIKTSFEKVFRGIDGEVVLNELGGICIPSLGEYEPDPYKAAYREGQRNMFFKMLNLADMDVRDFLNSYRKLSGE